MRGTFKDLYDECENLTTWEVVFELKQLKSLGIGPSPAMSEADGEELRRQLPSTKIRVKVF